MDEFIKYPAINYIFGVTFVFVGLFLLWRGRDLQKKSLDTKPMVDTIKIPQSIVKERTSFLTNQVSDSTERIEKKPVTAKKNDLMKEESKNKIDLSNSKNKNLNIGPNYGQVGDNFYGPRQRLIPISYLKKEIIPRITPNLPLYLEYGDNDRDGEVLIKQVEKDLESIGIQVTGYVKTTFTANAPSNVYEVRVHQGMCIITFYPK